MDAVLLQQTAWTLLDNGKITDAIPYLSQARDRFVYEDGPQSLDAANLSMELASIQLETSSYEDAAVAARAALQILGRFREMDPLVATIVVQSQGILSVALRATGRTLEAQHAILEAVRIAETVLGSDHRLTAAALNGLGMFYQYGGDFARAEGTYLRAIGIQLACCGGDADHIEMADFYRNLASLFHMWGNTTAGIELSRRAFAIRSKALGPDHLRAVSDQLALAVMLDEIDATAEAQTIYRRTLPILRQAYGPEHVEIASALHNLAVLHRDLGELTEAGILFSQAFEMRKRLLGEANLDTAKSATCLAQVLRRNGELQRAAAILDRAREVYEASQEQPGKQQPCDRLPYKDLLSGLIVVRH